MDSWRFSWCSRKASWILLHHLLGHCFSVRHRSPISNYRNPTSSSSFSLHASWTIAQEDAQPTVAAIWCCRFTS